MSDTIWYTRCPIATASGIAFQRSMFGELFRGSKFQVRNINELPSEKMESHFDHSVENSFRDGGCAPAIWAHSIGANTALLGITFIEESLMIFVRDGSEIRTVADLAGRRLALPVVKGQRINFARFAALKGYTSALRLYGLTPKDVTFVDVVETRDKYANLNRDLSKPRPQSPYACQFEAILSGEVDAAFAKAGEAAYGARMASGKLRPIIDLRLEGDWESKINNATPRCLTVSSGLLDDNPDAAVRYVRTVMRAANWAASQPHEACRIMASEASVDPAELEACSVPDIHARMMPSLGERDIAAVEVAKSFLLEHGFLEKDFSLTQWVRPEILKEARARENTAVAGLDERGEQRSLESAEMTASTAQIATPESANRNARS